MDIRFYDLDFNLLKILPQFTHGNNSQNIGYISCNTTTEFNGNGNFELVFNDPEMKSIVEGYRDNLMVVWGDFQGVLTGYQWNKQKCTLFGLHLNGLLNRRVITEENTTHSGSGMTVELIARGFLTCYDYLTFKYSDEEFKRNISFTAESYQKGDTVIQSLLNLDNAGYRIWADLKEKRYYFEVLKSHQNNILLSESNLNAYDFVESYDNKSLATGGWWCYTGGSDTIRDWGFQECTTSGTSPTGIHRIETTLSADTLDKAYAEVANIKVFAETSCKTQNIKFGVDYKLGDVIRFQSGNVVSYKMVTGIKRWHENDIGEEPILSDFDVNLL